MEKEKISTHPENYQLGQRFLILTESNEIVVRQGAAVAACRKIEPKAMDVLLTLVEGQGRVVTRDYLIDRVWKNYGGGEEALIQAISKLRKAFGDDARSPKVIETIPKRGYRLLPNVQPADEIKGKGPLPAADPAKGRESTVVVQQVGLFTGFIERLTRPRFLLAFLLFSVVLIFTLAVLSYLIFWLGVMIGSI
jgi:DNA-binding winged helix-turn-helix (wHTH) protein